MSPALLYAGKDIVIASRRAVLVNIHDGTVDLENRDHFGHGFVHDQGVPVARRLIDIAVFASDPRVLQLPPTPLENEAMHRLRVTVPGYDARFPDPRDRDPEALRDR